MSSACRHVGNTKNQPVFVGGWFFICYVSVTRNLRLKRAFHGIKLYRGVLSCAALACAAEGFSYPKLVPDSTGI